MWRCMRFYFSAVRSINFSSRCSSVLNSASVGKWSLWRLAKIFCCWSGPSVSCCGRLNVGFLQCLVCPLCVPFPDFESNVLFPYGRCRKLNGGVVGFHLNVCRLLATIGGFRTVLRAAHLTIRPGKLTIPLCGESGDSVSTTVAFSSLVVVTYLTITGNCFTIT